MAVVILYLNDSLIDVHLEYVFLESKLVFNVELWHDFCVGERMRPNKTADLVLFHKSDILADLLVSSCFVCLAFSQNKFF